MANEQQTPPPPPTVVSGKQTLFGLNYDGSVDAQDNGRGYFNSPVTKEAYNTRDPNIVGASVPWNVSSAYGIDPSDPKTKAAIESGQIHPRVTIGGKTQDIPWVDMGPAGWTGAAIDLTKGAADKFGIKDNSKASYQLIGPDGNPMPLKGDPGVNPNAPVGDGQTRGQAYAGFLQQWYSDRSKFSGSLGVISPQDVQDLNNYIRKGGNLNLIPDEDLIKYNIAKNPQYLLQDNPQVKELFKKYVWEPNSQKDPGVALNDALGGIANYGGSLAQGLWKTTTGQADMFGKWAKMWALNNADPDSDQAKQAANEFRQSSLNAASTAAQLPGKIAEDTLGFFNGIEHGIAHLGISLSAIDPTTSPGDKALLNDKDSAAYQDFLRGQYALSQLPKQSQQLMSNSLIGLGTAGIINQAQVKGAQNLLAQGNADPDVSNFISFGAQLAGTEALGLVGNAVRPLFASKVLDAVGDVAESSGRAFSLGRSVQKPPGSPITPLTEEVPISIAAKQATADTMPSVRQASGKAAEDAQNLDALNQVIQQGSQNPTVSMGGRVFGALANAGSSVVAGLSKIAKTINGFPDFLESVTKIPSAIWEAAIGEHIGGLPGMIAGLGARFSPKVLDTISTTLGIMGKESMAGASTLPYWTRVAQQLTGLPRSIALGLDKPGFYALGSSIKGGLSAGAIGGGVGALSQPWDPMNGLVGGTAFGGIFGAVGGGYSQFKKYSSPEQFTAELFGDLNRYRQTLSKADLQNFNQLKPTDQLSLATYMTHAPDALIKYFHDPQDVRGFHDASGSRPVIGINLASDTPLKPILAHEFGHNAVTTGSLDAIYERMLGNSEKGIAGMYSLRDKDGNLVEDPGTGRYKPNADFLEWKKNYIQSLKNSPGSDISKINNESIARELYAEQHVDYALSGQHLVDAKSAYAPNLFFSPNLYKQTLMKLGLATDINGNVVRGTGLFSSNDQPLQKIDPFLGQLQKTYYEQRRNATRVDGESIPDKKILTSDLANRNISDAYFKNSLSFVRDKEGNIVRGADGVPVMRSAAEEKAYMAKVSDTIRNEIDKLSQDERNAAGIVAKPSAEGKVNYSMKYLPDKVLDAVSHLNEFPRELVSSLQDMNKAMKEGSGTEYQFGYHKRLTQAKKYSQFSISDRLAVPYQFELAKDNNLVVKAAHLGQISDNLMQIFKKDPTKNYWGDSFNDAVKGVDKYFENHANGLPGATGLDPNPEIASQKRDVINSALRLNVAHWRENNPLTAQLPNKTQPYIKSFRADSITNLRPTGVIRDFKGLSQYEQQTKNFLPRQDIEMVKSPAIRADDKVYESWSHGNAALKYLREKGLPDNSPAFYEGGFTTTHGRFVSREEALEIARKSKTLRNPDQTRSLHVFEYEPGS